MEKLINIFSLDFNVVGWILNFLTNRIERVRVNGHMSDVLPSSSGSPQGCVLSPVPHVLYTNDCWSRYDNRFILKFADGSVIVSLLHDNEIIMVPSLMNLCSDVMTHFCNWMLPKQRTCIDFRQQLTPSQTIIKGQSVQSVERCKYLGTLIDNKLNLNDNTDYAV